MAQENDQVNLGYLDQQKRFQQQIEQLRLQLEDYKSQVIQKEQLIKLLNEQVLKEKDNSRIAITKLNDYERKTSQLQDKVKLLMKGKKNVFSNITQIRIDLYYIEASDPRDVCSVCEFFVDNGFYKQFVDFKKTFEFPGEYQLKEIVCDPSSTYKTSSRFDLISEEGLNFFYAGGNDVEYYPTLDVFALTKNDKMFQVRFDGIGRYTPTGDIEITIIRDVSLWLISLSSDFKTFHIPKKRGDGMTHDYLMEKKILGKK